MKTKRQRNAEYLLRQGAKWEKERLLYEVAERKREAELKAKQDEALAKEQKYIENTGSKKMELLRCVKYLLHTAPTIFSYRIA